MTSLKEGKKRKKKKEQYELNQKKKSIANIFEKSLAKKKEYM